MAAARCVPDDGEGRTNWRVSANGRYPDPAEWGPGDAERRERKYRPAVFELLSDSRFLDSGSHDLIPNSLEV